MQCQLCGYDPDRVHPSQLLIAWSANHMKKKKRVAKQEQKTNYKDELHDNWTVNIPLPTLLCADCGLVCKNNIPPAVYGPMDIGLYESKPFRFGICVSSGF